MLDLKFFLSKKKKKKANTSNWIGIGFLVGSDRTVVHFFLSWELTSTTRLSLVHLSQEGEASLVKHPDRRHTVVQVSSVAETHGCLPLAEQYFLFLSASLTWPFLQHWPHTNISLRFEGPKRLCMFGSCKQKVNISVIQKTKYCVIFL